MKTLSLILFIGVLFACSDSDDCHDCHIAWENAQGQEVEVELGEFCGAQLSALESNGDTLSEPTVVGMDTVPAGYYPGSSIHCEEHAH